MPFTLNTELLTRTLDYIKAHPQLWDQEYWGLETECGTTACFAGWSCILAGAKLISIDVLDPANLEWVDVATLPKTAQEQIHAAGRTIRPMPSGDNYSVDVREAAETLLGLDDFLSAHLFAPDNDLADLERIVSRLCAEAIGAGV